MDINGNDALKVLEFLKKSGAIDLDKTIEIAREAEKKDIIAKYHKYAVFYSSSDDRWKTYIPCDNNKYKRKQIARRRLEDLEDYLIRFYNGAIDKSEAVTLRSLYPEWIEYRREHTTASTTIRRLNTDWKKYYLGNPIIDIPIKDIDKLTLDRFLHKMILDNSQTKTAYHNSSSIIKQCLEYAYDKGITDVNVWNQVSVNGRVMFRKVRKGKDREMVFTRKEIEDIKRVAIEDFNNRTSKYILAPIATLFQFQTGLRVGELCALQYDDIIDDKYIYVRRMVRRDEKEVVEHCKTATSVRMVPLTDYARELIAMARKTQEELSVETKFIFSVSESHLEPMAVSRCILRYCKKIGTVSKNTHAARRTYISALLDGGVNLNTVRGLVGHSDESQTLRSYLFDMSGEKEKISKIERAISGKGIEE